MQQFQFRVFQLSSWQMTLAIGLIAALLLGLMILALGIFLLVLPVAIIGGVVAYFFGGKRVRRNDDPNTIEAEYRVIEQNQIDRSKDERSSR